MPSLDFFTPPDYHERVALTEGAAMSIPVTAPVEKNIFRKTNSHTGRRVAISPSNSAMRHLAYARIILNSSKSAESFSTGDRETGLICLSGEATISVDGKEVSL